MTPIGFDNSYARDLPDAYVAWQPSAAPAPRPLFFNRALADELGLDAQGLDSLEGVSIFAGNTVPPGAQPLAQAYAGHQFGGFSPQLGDGRAVLLGEIVDRSGRRRDLMLKGSGRTPFARSGDGKAAVGPMLREALLGESMHALGVPTSRALAVVATGEPVQRERRLPGAVLTRVAASHLRVGTLQFFAARGQIDTLRQVADYAIARHDPALLGDPDCYVGLLRAVAQRQAALVAQWMNLGFIHGVMNTDNMTLSGETIDYGPCAFIEAYDPHAVFSSIDEAGRYAFGNQPAIARWNLARLAEALLPLIADDGDGDHVRHNDAKAAIDRVMPVIDAFTSWYDAHWRAGQRVKLGLSQSVAAEVAGLADDWLELLHAHVVDFTLGWRRLVNAAAGDEAPLRSLFANTPALASWLARWRALSEHDLAASGLSPAERIRRMRVANPAIIARNHQVERALAAATDAADLAPFERLLAALRHPDDEAGEFAAFAEPAPRSFTATYRTFCGT
ncbi:MAG: YdiU family protein [Azonexus sp.]|jgi:uncharacterized protein YdiU (UPF0061 family)|uniref:protein adenylyltransferase SelO n=1 Tax=Azonexus sp. TaxID=1872668 RepID=UPI002828B4D8|nr:YdiU family protein [Azonexus sp.]MDR0775911.1 YdiU family protein [Azonexus sp.]